MKQFLFGLGVALTCGTTAAAEGFWVCKVNDGREDLIINLHADRMVLVSEDAVFDSICSNNVCINQIDYGEDDAAYRIFNVDYQNDKPFSMQLTVVELEDQKPAIITTRPEVDLMSQCTKF